jgi:hypothetical protein
MFRTEKEINEAIAIVETGEGFSVQALLIDLLEEIRALKFGVGEIRKNEKQVKEAAKSDNKHGHEDNETRT